MNTFHIDGWTMTHHATTRATERGITNDELAAAIRNPTIRYDQSDYGPGRQMWQSGRISLAVIPAEHLIVTVLFRKDSEWHRHQQPSSKRFARNAVGDVALVA